MNAKSLKDYLSGGLNPFPEESINLPFMREMKNWIPGPTGMRVAEPLTSISSFTHTGFANTQIGLVACSADRSLYIEDHGNFRSHGLMTESNGMLFFSDPVIPYGMPEELQRLYTPSKKTIMWTGGFNEGLPLAMRKGIELIPISSIEELQMIGNHPMYPLDGSYYLTDDIDASGTEEWNAGEGFVPIGAGFSPFNGFLDGNGKTISGLHIDRNADNQALFGLVGNAEIVNLKFLSSSVVGKQNVAVLVGNLLGELSISKIIITASVEGQNNTAFVLGNNNGKLIFSEVSLNGHITGVDYTGTICGFNYGIIEGFKANATIDINGHRFTGGMVGYNNHSLDIERFIYWGDIVTTGNSTGGLIGITSNAAIECRVTDAAAHGSMTNVDQLFRGGIVGRNMNAGSTYYTNVLGAMIMDGVTSTQPVPQADRGGFMGIMEGGVTNTSGCFYDRDIFGHAKSHADSHGTPDIITDITTVNAMKQATYVGWTFGGNPWDIFENASYPQMYLNIVMPEPLEDEVSFDVPIIDHWKEDPERLAGLTCGYASMLGEILGLHWMPGGAILACTDEGLYHLSPTDFKLFTFGTQFVSPDICSIPMSIPNVPPLLVNQHGDAILFTNDGPSRIGYTRYLKDLAIARTSFHSERNSFYLCGNEDSTFVLNDSGLWELGQQVQVKTDIYEAVLTDTIGPSSSETLPFDLDVMGVKTVRGVVIRGSGSVEARIGYKTTNACELEYTDWVAPDSRGFVSISVSGCSFVVGFKGDPNAEIHDADVLWDHAVKTSIKNYLGA